MQAGIGANRRREKTRAAHNYSAAEMFADDAQHHRSNIHLKILFRQCIQKEADKQATCREN